MNFTPVRLRNSCFDLRPLLCADGVPPVLLRTGKQCAKGFEHGRILLGIYEMLQFCAEVEGGHGLSVVAIQR